MTSLMKLDGCGFDLWPAAYQLCDVRQIPDSSEPWPLIYNVKNTELFQIWE